MPLADLSNPILQPWTREALRKRNELVPSGKAPSLGIDCGPIGGVAFLVRTLNQPYFFVQAPDRVIIINQDDHQFRHIYLTTAHSRDVKPSWSIQPTGGKMTQSYQGWVGEAPIRRGHELRDVSRSALEKLVQLTYI